MEKRKIQMDGVPETMLQTVYARAKESQKADHHIYDGRAIEIVSALDYDFSAADCDSMMQSGVIARTILLDRMTEEYLSSHPDAVVVNIACGLDTRCYRVKGKYRRWYNLDLPETIAVRRRFFEETDTVRMIAASAADSGWAKQTEQENEPVLVIIEGLTMYLSEAEVKRIFSVISDRFPKVTVIAETMSPFVASHVKEKSIEGSHAKFSWGIRNGKELEKLIPPFRSVRDVSLTEGMQVFLPVYKFLGKIPFVRNISNKLFVLQKG